MQMLVHIMCLRNPWSYLHSFWSFCLSDWMNSTTLPFSALTLSSARSSIYWTPVLKFPVQLLSSSALQFICYFYILYLFFKILTLFVHCSPDLRQHLYDHSLRLFIRQISFSLLLSSVSGVCLILSFGTSLSSSSLSLTLSFGFYALSKAVPPRLEGVILCSRWTLLFNPALALGSLSDLLIVQATAFCFVDPSSWGSVKISDCPQTEDLETVCL